MFPGAWASLSQHHKSPSPSGPSYDWQDYPEAVDPNLRVMDITYDVGAHVLVLQQGGQGWMSQ